MLIPSVYELQNWYLALVGIVDYESIISLANSVWQNPEAKYNLFYFY